MSHASFPPHPGSAPAISSTAPPPSGAMPLLPWTQRVLLALDKSECEKQALLAGALETAEPQEVFETLPYIWSMFSSHRATHAEFGCYGSCRLCPILLICPTSGLGLFVSF